MPYVNNNKTKLWNYGECCFESAMLSIVPSFLFFNIIGLLVSHWVFSDPSVYQ